jgi:hypothetical protein
MTSQSSANFPKMDLKAAQNKAKQYKKRVLRAVFALLPTFVVPDRLLAAAGRQRSA